MSQVRQILVPLDFSETSEAAFDLALELAARFDAAVTVANFYELPMYGPEGTLLISEAFDAQLREGSAAELARRVSRRNSRARITQVVRRAIPCEGINALAEEINADMVVIGTHGRRGFKRALLGSVAENVVRTCTRPVLTVHAKGAGA